MSFTIKELESLSGIKAHTIRIWEQRYKFLQPSRTSTNIRRYNNQELKTLLTVALLNKYGYKISRIDEMLPGQRTEAGCRDRSTGLLPQVLDVPKQRTREGPLIGCALVLGAFAVGAVFGHDDNAGADSNMSWYHGAYAVRQDRRLERT